MQLLGGDGVSGKPPEPTPGWRDDCARNLEEVTFQSLIEQITVYQGTGRVCSLRSGFVM